MQLYDFTWYDGYNLIYLSFHWNEVLIVMLLEKNDEFFHPNFIKIFRLLHKLLIDFNRNQLSGFFAKNKNFLKTNSIIGEMCTFSINNL